MKHYSLAIETDNPEAVKTLELAASLIATTLAHNDNNVVVDLFDDNIPNNGGENHMGAWGNA